jgi:hypothetical protein
LRANEIIFLRESLPCLIQIVTPQLKEKFAFLAPVKTRSTDSRDLVLYLPDELTIVDYQREQAFQLQYDTVDRVEGLLRPEFDAIDAFLSHFKCFIIRITIIV